MNTILMIWTVVGYAGTAHSTHHKYDWRTLGEFNSPVSCEKAAEQLAIPKDRYRCVKK